MSTNAGSPADRHSRGRVVTAASIVVAALAGARGGVSADVVESLAADGISVVPVRARGSKSKDGPVRSIAAAVSLAHSHLRVDEECGVSVGDLAELECAGGPGAGVIVRIGVRGSWCWRTAGGAHEVHERRASAQAEF